MGHRGDIFWFLRARVCSDWYSVVDITLLYFLCWHCFFFFALIHYCKMRNWSFSSNVVYMQFPCLGYLTVKGKNPVFYKTQFRFLYSQNKFIMYIIKNIPKMIRHNYYVDKEVFFMQKSKAVIFDGKEGVIIIPPIRPEDRSSSNDAWIHSLRHDRSNIIYQYFLQTGTDAWIRQQITE